jgi:predicted dehydrogenase
LLWCSQIAAAEENDLNIRVYGSNGTLEWHQEEPNTLLFKDPAGPVQVYKRGNGYLSAAAQRAAQLPPGHPEAFYEAFANIFMNFTDTIRARLDGREPSELELDFPTVLDGARGVKFIEKVVESSQGDLKWLRW